MAMPVRFDISNRGVLSFAIRPDYDDAADQGENNTYRGDCRGIFRGMMIGPCP